MERPSPTAAANASTSRSCASLKRSITNLLLGVLDFGRAIGPDVLLPEKKKAAGIGQVFPARPAAFQLGAAQERIVASILNENETQSLAALRFTIPGRRERDRSRL